MEKLRPAAEAFKKKVGDNPVVMLEAGVYRGHYSHAIYNNFNCERLYLIDQWYEYYENGKYHVPEILDYAKRAMSFFDNCDNVMMIKFSSARFDLFPENHLDFAYLDNDHSYQNCSIEFEKYWKLIKPGAMLCGDNLECEGVRLALDELCAKYGLKYQTAPWKVNEKTGEPIASDWWIWKEDLKTVFINGNEYRVQGPHLSGREIVGLIFDGEMIDGNIDFYFISDAKSGPLHFGELESKFIINDGMQITVQQRD